jgi:hypothetical protein
MRALDPAHFRTMRSSNALETVFLGDADNRLPGVVEWLRISIEVRSHVHAVGLTFAGPV